MARRRTTRCWRGSAWRPAPSASPDIAAPATRTRSSSAQAWSPWRVQTLLFDRHTLLSVLNSPWEGLSFPALGWFAVWLVAAVDFVLARPWWDRRGRKPLRAPLVLGATFGLLLAIDLVLIVYRHSLPRARNVDLRTLAAFSLTSPLLWIFGGATIALLLDRRVARVEGRRRRPLAPPVARRRVDDRGRRAVRPAGPADPLPAVSSCRRTSVLPLSVRSRSWHSLHRNVPRPPVPVAPPTAHRR